MTDEELIKRLRKYKDDLLSITADRIEALVKERDNNHKVGLGWAEIAHQESNKYLQALRRIELLATTCEQLVATNEALVKQLAEADALIEAQAKDHASNNIRLAETAHRAERLEAALRAWTETIATVMPKDFKDWHQNSPDEWPLVTVRVIKSLQEQLDLFLDQSVTVGMEQLRAAFDAGCENGWDHARWESVYDPQPLGCEDAFNKFLAALNLTPIDNTNR